MKVATIEFPEFSGIRCLMMPYIQGRPDSVPLEFRRGYELILKSLAFSRGDIGYLTIDESPVAAGMPHRGSRAKHGRALHTEAGRLPGDVYRWGGGRWGGSPSVTLDRDTQVLLANNIDSSCALWDSVHSETTEDGDIGHEADKYPYESAIMMRSGEVHKIGIFTPHESLPIRHGGNRQFLRIISSGVHGREPYFTRNPILEERKEVAHA